MEEDAQRLQNYSDVLSKAKALAETVATWSVGPEVLHIYGESLESTLNSLHEELDRLVRLLTVDTNRERLDDAQRKLRTEGGVVVMVLTMTDLPKLDYLEAMRRYQPPFLEAVEQLNGFLGGLPTESLGATSSSGVISVHVRIDPDDARHDDGTDRSLKYG
jgi:hypothetical protein